MATGQPRPLTLLIGRVAELAAVGDCLARERLVSLVGSGGIGKTRLAIEAASRDGREATFVDLAATSGSDSVVTAVAAALGVQESGTNLAAEAIAASLTDRPVLVVLDNCEHVVDACAALIVHLLERCGALTVLTTSREPLGVPGEVVWRVPSLASPPVGVADPASYDAVALFVDRARRARPTLALTESTLHAVGEICRRLDGIALAIELAAAAVRVLPPDRIVAELDNRFALLTGGPRTALSRQQTLRASVEWSHDRLTADERSVFRRLGVFAGEFPLEAAEAVAAGDTLTGWAVFDVLSRLVDKSLVVYDDASGWYRVLETLRLFAIERCDAAGELMEARTAHARWWHAWLMAMGPDWSSDQVCALIDSGYPNVRSALRWLVTADREAAHDIAEVLASYWYMSGLFTDALHLSDAVLDGELAMRPQRWARTVASLCTVYWLARQTQVHSLIARAATIAADGGDELTALRCALVDLRGNPEPALLADQADRAIALGDRYLAVRILHTLTLFEYLRGDDPARWADRRVRKLVDTTGRELGVGQSWLWPARERCIAGDYRGAYALRQEAVAIPVRWRSPHTSLYLMIDGLWFPLLLGETEALAAGAHEIRSLRRDWGRHQPFATMLADLPDLLHGADPPSGLRALHESADLILYGFPPLHWLMFELLGPRPPSATRSGIEVIAQAVDATRLFATGDDRAAEPLLAAAAARPREDQHFWLTMLACAVASHDAHTVAARLFGAVERFQRRAEIPWMPTVLGDRRRKAILACEQALGVEQVAVLVDEGGELSLTEAAAYASRSRGERGRPSFGWDSLTPTELEVVRRVADGLTNAAIGAALFMSTPTVKTHLTHVYTKLGLASRAELAVTAARHLQSRG